MEKRREREEQRDRSIGGAGGRREGSGGATKEVAENVSIVMLGRLSS